MPSKTTRPAAPKAAQAGTAKATPTKRSATRAAGPRLLSGGNPQIPKGDGDAPVQAWIAAVPDWKQDVARRLDALVTGAGPGVRKAVKWNSPLYGAPGDAGWFLGLHCFTRYLKVSFFNGALLDPPPPGPSKVARVRYLDIHADDAIDAAQILSWVTQAMALPGEKM